MGKIHILTKEISNKIAAGEVVERPASIVKELVENSIDAGASTIEVEIKNGGSKYIRVTDDGCGMSPEDAATAFLRHATSKIQNENDLDAIYTLGFRGEALSSIGAVSIVDMYTREKNAEFGAHVKCTGGNIISADDAGSPEGTTFIVQDLFFNTPARQKFLKRDATEASYINDIMTRFILAHPEISFIYKNNGKEQLFSSGNGNLIDAVYTVYGKDYAKSCIPVDYQTEYIHLTGVAGKGIVSRPNRTYQSFFVNKRYIKSPVMIKALEEAYKNIVMIGKYPMAVLNIDIDPSAIDINVHPTKLEVKFSDERQIYQTIYFGVKNALYAEIDIPSVERTDKKDISDTNEFSFNSEPVFSPEPPKEQMVFDNTAYAPPKKYNDYTPKSRPENPFLKKSDKTESVSSFIDDMIEKEKSSAEYLISNDTEDSDIMYEDDSIITEDNNDISDIDNNKKDADVFSSVTGNSVLPNKELSREIGMGFLDKELSLLENETKSEAYSDLTESEKRKKQIEQIKCTTERLRELKNIMQKFGVQEPLEPLPEIVSTAKIRDYKIIGQLFNTYILAERNNELIMVDQHAAHERINYERFIKIRQGIVPPSQYLLESIKVSLTDAEYVICKENKKRIEKLGFVINIKQDKVEIMAVPSGIEGVDVENLLVEIITNIADNKENIVPDKVIELLYSASCKNAIKANHRLQTSEMLYLLDEVFAMDNINTCPHGRPIIISMSKKEIEKEFKRIV